MFPELTPDQLELRDELRAYFSALMSPAERAEMLTERHGAAYREVVRRMGHDGWLGVGWPARFGGRGFGQVEQQIFADEAARADVPLPAVTLQTVGPTLHERGTPWQQDFFLPKILAGELHFAIGYTEPEAGTDLAALRTRAVRDGDDYVVDGQKIFTTGAHEADYIWLACRTDPDALPAWRPAEGTLPEEVIDMTPTFVIASALATRDFYDVHHDRNRAVARGARDIFVNILTTTGLVQRYVSGWAGPGAVIRPVSVRLGVPCHAGETLTLSGHVTAADGSADHREQVVSVTGRCGLGDHVTATVRIEMPR